MPVVRSTFGLHKSRFPQNLEEEAENNAVNIFLTNFKSEMDCLK